MIFSWMEMHHSTFSVKGMCNFFDVSRSGFYEWLSRPESGRAIEEKKIVKEIKMIHEETHGTYGSPRMTVELNSRGQSISKNRVERIMRKYDISTEKPRIFRVRTTDSNHDLPVASNLLDRDFSVGTLNHAWVSDLTYIETTEGFAYLTLFHDLGNREPVGWHLSANMATEGVLQALQMAVSRRKPPAGLIIHSDRGSQYASALFREYLNDYNFVQSMSRKGNCWDNAVAESFFHSLKTECLYRLNKIPTLEELRKILFDYIEVFYIRKRRHSSLGYLSPMEYAKQLA
ncbi:IS3 family transposase [candidate division KSB1 bacterium]|nr:IS3 family transposase [candidate division KSB1 bacterium]